MAMSFRLDGRRALVTGGAGGLGRAIADGLTELGASVAVTTRDAGTATRLADQYGSAYVLDVLDVASIQGVVDDVWDSGPIDVLVNNAGVNRPAPAMELTQEAWDEVVDTNLRGAFFVAQAVARRMIESGTGGSIVNIGSQAGSVGIEERAAYCASKGGVAQMTKVLALELAQHGIRVNNVAPTFVLTELTRSTLENPDLRDEFLSRIPLGRFGEPDDVAGAVAYLAGDMASMVTGHTLLVDGGWTAR
jgi:NAD(P)-dependent dehydrogenase (short-subunit alcohol dehydrogenase family)